MAIICNSTVDVSFSYRQDHYVLLEGYFSDANCAVSQLSMVLIRDTFSIGNLAMCVGHSRNQLMIL